MSTTSKSTHELTRKEMKAPDKFQAAATEAASWAVGRKKQIVGGLAVLLALAVAAAAISTWRSAKAAKAGGLLFQALTAADGQVSSVPLPNTQGPFYKTDEERQRAVAEAAKRTRETYPSTRAATTAALAEADARYRLGELDAAAAGYQAYLDGTPKDEPLRFLALDGVARVQERKGQLAEAAQTWERAGEVKAFADRAALERARVLAQAGKTDEAKKLLAGFPDQFKDSRLRPEAAERLAKLGR